MEYLSDVSTIFRELCKAKQKWGLQVYFPPLGNQDLLEYVDELQKAAPYLTRDMLIIDCYNAMLDTGTIFFFFDSEEEMNRHYRVTVGDDGPTKTNPYNGPVKIYALTCDPSGQLMNENT